MLEEQLGQERRRTTLDFSDRDFKMKSEYEKRLKSELKGLRKKYKQETERTKKEFTNLHLKKVGLANTLDKINRDSTDRLLTTRVKRRANAELKRQARASRQPSTSRRVQEEDRKLGRGQPWAWAEGRQP